MKIRIAIGTIALTLCLTLTFWLWRHPLYVMGISEPTIPQIQNPHPISDIVVGSTVKVMAVGGSVALGWDDQTKKGYLVRGFDKLSTDEGVKYELTNESVEGYGPEQLAGKYSRLLQQEKPSMVVISWGMLDDVSNGTPISEFRQDIHDEIAEALKSNMYVLVVSPPATEASYTMHTGELQKEYIEQEFDVADSFNSPNVYVVDLLSQMQTYIANHNQTISQYSADSWHPNTAGHELAGALLAEDMEQQLVHPQAKNSGKV